MFYRDRRDQLRLGLDRMCTDFTPALTYNRPTLHFIPVCISEGSEDVALRTFIPDRFVVGKWLIYKNSKKNNANQNVNQSANRLLIV